MRGKISVIMPVYNAKRYLSEAIESVLAQTYTNLELILVDDGSRDGSAGLCDRYAAEDVRVRVIHRENAGVAAARESGIREAKAELVYFLDADDWVEPEALELLMDCMERYEADIAVGNVREEAAGKKTTATVYRADTEVCIEAGEAVAELLKQDGTNLFLGHAWNKLYKKETLRQVRIPKEIGVLEDLLLVYLAMKGAGRICYTGVVTYHYRQHPDSAMHQLFSEKTFSSILAAARIYEEVRRDEPMLFSQAVSLLARTCLKQASLCAYSREKNRWSYLEKIRAILRKLRPEIGREVYLTGKDRVLLALLVLHPRLFYGCYRLLVAPFRRRAVRKEG